jgi:hypothetical protein
MDFLTKVLAAMVGRILADDLRAWFPSLTDGLINLAVRRLPSDLQERYSEEWRAHIADTPGEIGKLFCATGFLWAGCRVEESLWIESLRGAFRKNPGISNFLVSVCTIMPFSVAISFVFAHGNYGKSGILLSVGLNFVAGFYGILWIGKLRSRANKMTEERSDRK